MGRYFWLSISVLFCISIAAVYFLFGFLEWTRDYLSADVCSLAATFIGISFVLICLYVEGKINEYTYRKFCEEEFKEEVRKKVIFHSESRHMPPTV